MKTVRKIELLAPAKDKQIGKEAILHGADAVYIGIEGFSARSAAGNSIEDIAELIDFAHIYNAHVYVAMNTILYDKELSSVEKLIHKIYRVGADALIVQDMGILQLNIPPIPLHASTQTDNRTVEKVRFLKQTGFSQVVLARELSIGEIAEIASQTSVPLEVFVHGALCVSYSGQCYLSQAIAGRSANRGECAQLCRLPYDLVDANGQVLQKNAHLLSLKDLNQSEHLEALLEAGVSSLKIEGRLKDVSYVKNVVSAYRQKLDEIFNRRPEFTRTSSGISKITFAPNLSKSFNRGFTDYFSYGRQHDIVSSESPKSVGEYIGTIKSVGRNSMVINTKLSLHNGDGLCFIDRDGLTGFRVNRAEGNTIFPAEMPNVNVGTKIYRNYDHEFETQLSKKTADRKISAVIAISELPFGFALQIRDEDGVSICLAEPFEKNPAKTEQTENIRAQLSRTGNTPFEIKSVNIDFDSQWFIPSSILSDWRKKLVEKLLSARRINYRRETKKLQARTHPFTTKELTYLGNVSNEKSRLFYNAHHTEILQPSFEQVAQKNVPLMTTRHCIKYTFGYCPKETTRKNDFKEPLYLMNGKSKLRLSFDCKECLMQIAQNE
ncbi:MAG: U32 family peptidase [Dysgonomonadaceae bacterium]|nr:U32 family peptidase [Dysgonamonadaceae bacterium]